MPCVDWPEPGATALAAGREVAATGWPAEATRHSSEIPPKDAAAARRFYSQALRGRQVLPSKSGDGRSLWFVVGGTLVEVAPERPNVGTPVTLDVDDPEELAERCWDAGFTVRVRQDATGQAPVSVVDPFGRRIDLVPRTAAMRPRRTADEARR